MVDNIYEDGLKISNREKARRLISDNCFRNTLKTFKMTDGILCHPKSGRANKLQTASQSKVKLS